MLLTITLLLMIIGFIGILVPGLPGIGLIFLASLGYGFLTDFSQISGLFLVSFAGITALALGFDYLGGILGAKKFGASKSGVAGGLVGGILGLLTVGLLGLVVGQFFGTVVGELYKGRELDSSMKSGLGSLMGYILSVAVNTSLGLLMIVLFVIRVL